MSPAREPVALPNTINRICTVFCMLGVAAAQRLSQLGLSETDLQNLVPTPDELFYPQKLDHFNSSDQRTFSQRYLLNKESWGRQSPLPNGCPGPILLYTGNEGPIDAFWGISGFITQVLAPSLGGMLLFPEERYYGKSLPFGPESLLAGNVRYLTTAQVIEDLVAVVTHVKRTVAGAETCPVIAFGGSYGGTLTALLRASHPETVIGGLAASSELGYYDEANWKSHGVDEFTFEDVATATWTTARPGCLGAIQRASAAVDAAPEAEVVRAFGACDREALGPGPASTMFAYVLEGMPQGDYPSLGFPVTKACDRLLDAQRSGKDEDMVEAAASIVRDFYKSPSCVPYDVGGPGNTPGDGPGPSAWGYQSCVETLHAFSARTLRNFTFSLATARAQCEELYNHTVAPNLEALSKQFGGAYALAEGTAAVTHLIWSQGTLDPWHGWFKNMRSPPPGSEVYHFLMEGSAHHTDLRLPDDADPPDVVSARTAEERIIKHWIAEYVAKLSDVVVV